MLIGSSVVAILFQLIGLIGAWKEHFCLSCTYAVLAVLGLIYACVNAFGTGGVYWGSWVVSLVVTITAVLFTIDLRKIQLAQVQPGHYPGYAA